jgi:hypothetical protein
VGERCIHFEHYTNNFGKELSSSFQMGIKDSKLHANLTILQGLYDNPVLWIISVRIESRVERRPNMPIVSSKQTPKYLINIDLIFALFALALVLLILVPSNVNIYNSLRTAPGVLDRIHLSGDVSFAADQHYWTANCSQDWASDARCGFIAARIQSCSISTVSAYCTEYKHHLQEYLNK